jgi:hypothetical protein
MAVQDPAAFGKLLELTAKMTSGSAAA